MKGWVLGVLLTIVSAAGSTSGLILQKIAHTREQKAVKDGIKTNTLKCFDIPCNKYFIAGFIMLAFVPLPFDFVALANAGQSIILPVGTGCTVIFGQLSQRTLSGQQAEHFAQDAGSQSKIKLEGEIREYSILARGVQLENRS